MSWYPEICYEETEGGVTSKIPFIPVPKDQIMPPLLFIFESRETGDFEPGMDGEEVPVLELDLHQYADMAILKKNLSQEHYDIVRGALGLEPLKDAVSKGKQISQSVKESVAQIQQSSEDAT